MQLRSFEVENYRCVDESNKIEVRDQTALVGRNESGKTNLLLALQSLNPPGGMTELNEVKDFPRDRNLKEFDGSTRVVHSEWSLSAEEQRELSDVFPRAKDVTRVTVSRSYAGKRFVGFRPLPPLERNESLISKHVNSLERSVNASLRAVEGTTREVVATSLKDLTAQALDDTQKPKSWASDLHAALESFENDLTTNGLTPGDKAREAINTLRSHAEDITNDATAHKKAIKWVTSRLPVFVYLDEYPRIEGHQDLPSYLKRRKKVQEEGPSAVAEAVREADENFAKLMKVAGLDAEELHELLDSDHERRMQLVNRASAYVTQRIQKLWTDRDLKIRFNLDREHFDTLVIDSQAVYDVEVNLNERSRGFKWFFSFYVTFTADTQGGPKENAILLLDEPGIHLHAVAQEDLLRHFAEDFENQIIYTTHSPFMIPTDNIPAIRTVTISQETGTKVTNDPTGDAKTLFPLQTALGYSISQTLFVGKRSLVVEGVTDYWYLSSVSEYFGEEGRTALVEDIVLTPAGGAQKVSYMVALLASQNLDVAVLLDAEDEAKRTAMQDLVKQKLIRDDYLVFISEGFRSGRREADVEDLLSEEVYGALVREAYSEELEGKSLKTNQNIPRLVVRFEKAFEDVGLGFHKTRPAKLFVRKMSEDPASVLSDTSADRFELLFEKVNESFEKRARRRHGPFE